MPSDSSNRSLVFVTAELASSFNKAIKLRFTETGIAELVDGRKRSDPASNLLAFCLEARVFEFLEFFDIWTLEFANNPRFAIPSLSQ